MTDDKPTTNHTDRTIDLSVEVPGTVEEVWRAVATGPGITSWFIPMEVEERSGGTVRMDWGSYGTQEADVVAFEPPHRVLFRGREPEGAMAFEWLVEAKDEGSCVVRLVNSGFGQGDEWDAAYHGMTEGWKNFMENLRLHLTHFRDGFAHAVIPTVKVPGPSDAAWKSLCTAMGISPDAGVGDRVATSGDAPPLAGTVHRVMKGATTKALLLLLDAPHPGTAFITTEGDGDEVPGSTYLYLYDTEDRPVDPTIGEQWVSWLGERFDPMTAEDVGAG